MYEYRYWQPINFKENVFNNQVIVARRAESV